MARKQARDVRGETMAVPTPDGQDTIHVQLPPRVDYSYPHKDDDGNVPEFVNFSPQVQQVKIPYHDHLHVVPPMGILRGSQWRNLTKPNRNTWGDHPKFVERVPAPQTAGKDEKLHDPDDPEDMWSPAKGSNHDRKYLLTVEQVVGEINKLSNPARIEQLTRHGVIMDTEDLTRLGYRRQHQGPIDYQNTQSVCARPRLMEDRQVVMAKAQERLDWIKEETRKAKEAQGIFED